MIDIRISAAIVSGYILLVLATPVRWFHHGWRELSYPSLKIQGIVEEEMVPINKLLKILTLIMVLHGFWVNVLHPLAVRLREREQMEREREWRNEQLRRIAEIQRQERNRAEREGREERQKMEEKEKSDCLRKELSEQAKQRRRRIGL